MSIVDETGHRRSITEVWRALRLFIDREEFIKLFVSYVNDDPAPDRILFFYGDGGNGKSLLMLQLREYFCKRFTRENWDWLKNELSDFERIEQIKQATENLLPTPVASIDFGMKTTSEDYPQEVFSGLLTLRRQLNAYGIKFPIFDFACIWYLHKTKQLSKQRLETIFPGKETDFILEVIRAASGTSYIAVGKAIFGIFAKYVEGDFTLWLKRRALDETSIDLIQQMNAETELLDYLPELFASDLNDEIARKDSYERIILFFDTHESFWGHQRGMPKDKYFLRDKWLRQLLGKLELSRGVVVTLAGRELPLWNEAPPPTTIPSKFVEGKLVEPLSPADAQAFLQEAESRDDEVKQGLADYSQIEKDDLFQNLVAHAQVKSGCKSPTSMPTN
jgi:hypothetical protein